MPVTYEDETKTERFVIHVGPKLKAEIERQAKAARRDASEWARLVLIDTIRGHQVKVAPPEGSE